MGEPAPKKTESIEVPASWGVILGDTPHPTAAAYHACTAHTRCIFKGNQGGATHAAMHDVALRFLGIHPVPERNRLNKPIRCVSKTLPKGPGDEENQQYVEFRRKFPPENIKKDVTARSSIMELTNPFGGPNYKLEFMSSSQEIDAFMSVQRSAYYQDEEIDRLKWDESQVRLLREGGDCTICLTPVRGLDWTYDDLWMQAERIQRSKTISAKFGFPRVETRNNNSGIECFCWATDDNPVMTQESIDRIFRKIVDPDDLAMRRYGVFKQASGRIYKLFDRNIHAIDTERFFNRDRFSTFWQYRIIDYHPRKPWYISFVAVTPQHEWFVWNEMQAFHHLKTTIDLRDDIKMESIVNDEDTEINRATLVDPLAKVKQPSVGASVFDDLRSGELGLRRCIPADTKNERGRLEIHRRLKNAAKCRIPFHNERRDGSEPDTRFGNYHPTLWFMDSCQGHLEHFERFRYKEYKEAQARATKDAPKKDSHEDRYSDFCRNLEFLGAFNPVWYPQRHEEYTGSGLFQGRKRA